MTLFGRYVYAPVALLFGAEIGVAALAFTVSHVLLYQLGAGAEARVPLLLGLLFSAAVVVSLAAMGLYQAKQRLEIEGVLARVVVGVVIAAIGMAVLAFVFPLGMEGPLWASSFGICLVLLALTRILLWRWWADHEVFRRRVLVYGAGSRAASLLKLRRRSDRRGFEIAAFIPAPGDGEVLPHDRVRAIEGSLHDYSRANRVDEIVIAMDDRRQGFPIAELLACKFSGIAVIDLLSFLERETGRLKVNLVNPSWLIFSDGFRVRTRLRVGSRIVDLVLALALLVIAAPIMLVVALAILITDGRPVLYRQKRVGLLGKTFTLQKFRTMTSNAEQDGKPQWATENDVRVTSIGKTVRKLRLDELPQLFNVLAGSMSLVGPRPERPEFVEHLAQQIPYYHERHSVTPGITGWAQLCYPYGSSKQDAMEKLEYDLYYIKHKTLVFDLMVLLQTVEVVLWGKGAR